MPHERKLEREGPQSNTRRREKVGLTSMVNPRGVTKAEYTMNIPNKNKHQSKLKWIGLINVKPRPGNSALGNALGAFVASIALADGPEEYGRKVTEALNEYGFDVVQIEDVELFEDRVQKHSVTPDILELAAAVTQENPVALADFHSYIE